MTKDDDVRMSGALQENVLTLLCFDDDRCKLIRAAVTPRLFDSAVFREIAGHAIDFIDQFGEAIKEHLPDHLEDILKGDDDRKASTYKRLVDNLFLSREHVNGDYVLSQLHQFVRQQNLKSALIKAVEAVEDGKIDEAEVALQKGLQSQVNVFEGGLNLASGDDLVQILDEPEEEGFEIGIEELDRNGVIPRRKEAFCFLAPRGKGKSWSITHVAKHAMLQRWKVLVISLEMSEKRYATRFLQSFFSIAKREAEVNISRLVKDKGGSLEELFREVVKRRTLKDEDIREFIASKARREFRKRPPLRIKSFPSGTLTLAQLEAYLDGLERFENFVPDLICVDYPALMQLDPNNLRIAHGQMIVGLRGLAVKRNAAMYIVAQGNRESEKASLVTGAMASEDISLLATVDNLVTYSQTIQEYQLGLARIFVEKARNEEAKQTILISQAYHIGQFCLDSVVIDQEYWDLVEEVAGKGRRREDDR